MQQNDRDMFSGLRSKYNQMSSYLTQCFAYSSFFPKGYKMHATVLIQLWMALGALQSTIQHHSSFIRDEHYNPRPCFFNFKKLEVIIGYDTHVSEYGNVRHLSFSKHSQDTLYGFNKENNVVSVVICHERRGPLVDIFKAFISKCILRFKCLRVFDLSHSSFEELPSSIGELKH